MPTSVMVGLHTNISTFSDNAMATRLAYNPHNASASTINNMFQLGGMGYIPQITPSLNMTFMMAMRQQMNESNLELVNTSTQQMGTIFSPLISNINQTYKLFANQMGRIIDFLACLKFRLDQPLRYQTLDESKRLKTG